MAESFLLVAQQVLMLYLIMAVGFVLGKARLIDDRGSVAMSNLVMYAVSPSILVVAFQRELDMASLRNFGLVLLVALAVHILAAVSVLLVRDKDPQRQSCLRFAVVFANCGFMGYPLMSAMLGSEGVFYGSAYVVVFTVLSWTLGVYIMTRDRHCLAIKPIFCNPGTISVIVAMALYLLQIQLPEILLVPITHLSNLNTPLPMVVLGYQLSHANFRVALQGRGAWVSMILRLVVLPLAALGGAVCWGTYLLAGCATESVFLQSFAASAATAIWSETFARVKKTPAQQYLIIGLIPLVPGGTLYYAMSALVRQDWGQAQLYGYRVSAFVLGIAAGVSLTLSLLDMLLNARRRIQNRR